MLCLGLLSNGAAQLSNLKSASSMPEGILGVVLEVADPSIVPKEFRISFFVLVRTRIQLTSKPTSITVDSSIRRMLAVSAFSVGSEAASLPLYIPVHDTEISILTCDIIACGMTLCRGVAVVTVAVSCILETRDIWIHVP